MVNVIQNMTDFLTLPTQGMIKERTHICLYASILVLSQQHGSSDTIEVSRRKLMSLSKIKSFATYHKCISELENCGYIKYMPSYHPIFGSQIVIL